MLHGNSWPNLKQIYFDSFNLSASRQAVFGYLDHPLSSRYDYGWESYEKQVEAHTQLLDYFKSNFVVKSISHEDLSDWLKIRLIELDLKNNSNLIANIKINKLKKLKINTKIKNI